MTNAILGTKHPSLNMLGDRDTFTSRAYTHTIGMWIFLSFATLPAQIKTVHMMGQFPLKIADALLFLALILRKTVSHGKFRSIKILPPIGVVLFGVCYGIYQNAQLSSLVSDTQSLLYLVGAFLLFSSISSTKQLLVLIRYATVCLIVSAVIEVLIIRGGLTYDLNLRSSVDSNSVLNLGRIVTPSYFLGEVTISLCITLYMLGRVRLQRILIPFSAALVIVILAGTRLSIVFFLAPIFFAFGLQKREFRANKIIRKAPWILYFSTIIVLTISSLSLKSETVFTYASNIFLRLVQTINLSTGTFDSSTVYRINESQRAFSSILGRPFFGTGLGIPYSSQSVSGTSKEWLVVNGPLYVHESPLWLLVKFGFLGTVVFLWWLFYAIGRSRGASDLVSALRISIYIILIVSFVWNIFAGWGESVAFGSLLGLQYAMNKGMLGQEVPSNIKGGSSR